MAEKTPMECAQRVSVVNHSMFSASAAVASNRTELPNADNDTTATAVTP